MQDLKVCLVQSDLIWEDKAANLLLFEQTIAGIEGTPDLIVLPEMFSTGFSMNTQKCAEEEQDKTLKWMQLTASYRNCVITGSAMIREGKQFYNRLFWVHPDGSYQTYNKKHLFRFGQEDEFYTAGQQRIIAEVKGWKFCLQICYDLRFPVWTRNRFKDGIFDYDALLFVANWPERRAHHWKQLLVARAIENMSFSIGVNRVGVDGNSIPHSGNSLAVDPLGTVIGSLEDHQPGVIEVTLSAEVLSVWREKFKVGMDWDMFELQV
jgi:predicted amidohydrolase